MGKPCSADCNVVAESNPIDVKIFFTLNGEEDVLVLQNTPEGSLAFAIAVDTLYRLGGNTCVKLWVNNDAEFIGILTDVDCGDKFITI